MRSFTSTKVAKQVRLEQFAWVNRRVPTESEARLWEAIRGRKLGVQFRRQVVLAGYIVDFVSPTARLVVEVDGPYHADHRRRDGRRDRRLGELGFRVLRIEAGLVMRDLRAAVRLVATGIARAR
jgi:guanylate kinase